MRRFILILFLYLAVTVPLGIYLSRQPGLEMLGQLIILIDAGFIGGLLANLSIVIEMLLGGLK